MLLDLRDVSNCISMRNEQYFDLFTYKNYCSYEISDMTEEFTNRLIKVPQFYDIYRFELILSFIEKYEDYWQLLYSYLKKHPFYHKLVKSSNIITEQRSEIVSKFIEKKRSIYPKLIEFIERIDDSKFHWYFLDALDCSDYWLSLWCEFKNLYILRLTTDWCIDNSIPFIYKPWDTSVKYEVDYDEDEAIQLIIDRLEAKGISYKFDAESIIVRQNAGDGTESHFKTN